MPVRMYHLLELRSSFILRAFILTRPTISIRKITRRDGKGKRGEKLGTNPAYTPNRHAHYPACISPRISRSNKNYALIENLTAIVRS